ncbi:hypothetical protein ACS0TY_003325 [Phlomoides rotata]
MAWNTAWPALTSTTSKDQNMDDRLINEMAVHGSEHPGMILVSHQLTDMNFSFQGIKL